MDWWTVINRARAIENLAYVVASNQGATLRHYPPFSWPGGSMVVDFDGRILAQADPGPGEKIVVAEVDVESLRTARESRRGHNHLAHLRSETYTVYRESYYPGGSHRHASVPDGDWTAEQSDRAARHVVPRGGMGQGRRKGRKTKKRSTRKRD
jgi:hypothetical protein